MRIETPVKLTPEVRLKMEEAAALDASWEEIAFYAGISKATLYNWLESLEGLKERLDELKQRPLLKARNTIVKALDQPEHAKWFMERKRKREFGNAIDHTTNGKELGVILYPTAHEGPLETNVEADGSSAG